MGTHQHSNSPWLLLSNSKIMANHYSDDMSFLCQPGQSLLLRASWREKSTFSATLSWMLYLGFFKRSYSLGRLLGSEGERWGHTPPPPSARAPQWAALPARLGALQAQWTGDIHTVNDSSGSGTTERIENGCKDDYYNFQHLSPKS